MLHQSSSNMRPTVLKKQIKLWESGQLMQEHLVLTFVITLIDMEVLFLSVSVNYKETYISV